VDFDADVISGHVFTLQLDFSIMYRLR